MIGIIHAIRFLYNIPENKQYAKSLPSDTLISTIHHLSNFSPLIDLIAENVHDSWRNLKVQSGIKASNDIRITLKYKDLDTEMQRISRQNAKADLLSLVLYLSQQSS